MGLITHSAAHFSTSIKVIDLYLQIPSKSSLKALVNTLKLVKSQIVDYLGLMVIIVISHDLFL